MAYKLEASRFIGRPKLVSTPVLSSANAAQTIDPGSTGARIKDLDSTLASPTSISEPELYHGF